MVVHPCLFLNQERIETAKRNIAHYDWARKLYHELRIDADKLADMELPTFSTAWWQEARNKRWQDVYPEVAHHTYFVPRTAAELAWKSALVYRLGGGDIYAKRAKRVLLHYTSYTFEVEHPDVGMNWTTWGIALLWAYDALYEYCGQEERAALDGFFTRLVGAVAKCDEFWIKNNPGGRLNNHYAWHKTMMVAYGIFYGDNAWVDRALYSENGIKELIVEGLLDNGIWFESSLNYHFTALWALCMAANMFRSAGYPVDLYTHQFAKGRTLEDAFSGILELAFPDLTLPTIGDAYGRVMRIADSPVYDYAWIAYHKPVYAWLLHHKKGRLDVIRLFEPCSPIGVSPQMSPWVKQRLSPPPAKSRVFPQHGYVMLRSVEGKNYWGSESWAVFMSYDLDSIHSHRDKLGLVLFGRGKQLGRDVEALPSEQHAFSSRVQRELNRSTICHNTLMVDGLDHRPVGEKLSLTEFKSLRGVKTATVADLEGKVYPGVRLQRSVVVTSQYVLDVFQAVSESEHIFDWLFHAGSSDGVTSIQMDDGMKAELTKVDGQEWASWSWLKNPRQAQVGETWHAVWRCDDVYFRLTMLGAPGTEVIACDFPRNDKFEPPPIPMLMVRRRGASALFVALYQAEKGQLPETHLTLSQREVIRIVVKVGQRSYAHEIKLLGL